MNRTKIEEKLQEAEDCIYRADTYRSIDYWRGRKSLLLELLAEEGGEVKETRISEYLETYFRQMRFNDKHHLGLGDIRLTVDQQDVILSYVKHLEASHTAQKGGEI